MVKFSPLTIQTSYKLARLAQILYHHSTNLYGTIASALSPRFSLHPLVLRLRVTKRCNLKCSYCYQADSLNKIEKNHLILSEWEKILNHLPPWTIIDITGGEPFVATGFKETLELILTRKFKTSLITNGTRCDDQTLEMLVQKKLTYFMVSLDGLEAVHNQLRGNNKAFQNAVHTLQRLDFYKKKHKSKFPLTCIKTTVTPENFTQLLDLHDFAFEKLAVDNQSINIMFQNSVRGGNEIYSEINERFQSGNTAKFLDSDGINIATAIKKTLEKGRLLKRPVDIKPSVNPEQLENYFKNPSHFGVKECSKIRSVLTMYYDGSLSPCDIGLRVGNIRDLNFNVRKIWNSNGFSSFYSFFKNEKSYKPFCEGCCLMPHKQKIQ